MGDPIHGHGHVVPRLDGAVARCGGPGICDKCYREKAQHEAEKKKLVESMGVKEGDGFTDGTESVPHNS